MLSANLFWTGVLAVTVAAIMASSFLVILVYTGALLPGQVGLLAGMFFGFFFGLGGLGPRPSASSPICTQHRDGLRVTPFLLC